MADQKTQSINQLKNGRLKTVQRCVVEEYPLRLRVNRHFDF